MFVLFRLTFTFQACVYVLLIGACTVTHTVHWILSRIRFAHQCAVQNIVAGMLLNKFPHCVRFCKSIVTDGKERRLKKLERTVVSMWHSICNTCPFKPFSSTPCVYKILYEYDYRSTTFYTPLYFSRLINFSVSWSGFNWQNIVSNSWNNFVIFRDILMEYGLDW